MKKKARIGFKYVAMIIIRSYKDLIIMSEIARMEEGIKEEAKNIEALNNELLTICKILNQRSRTLYRIIFFRMAYLGLMAPHIFLNPKDFEAKRGRKSEIPIKEVMEILKVSHRTAQDYVRFLRAFKLVDDLALHVFSKISMGETLEQMKKVK